MSRNTVSIAKIRFLGSCFKNNSARVLGHDGAYSIPLSNGKVFWSFGDTLLGPERRGYDPQKIDLDTWVFKDSWAKENVSMISNSGLIAGARDISELMYGGFQYFIHKRTVDGKEQVEAREIIPVPNKLKHKKEQTAFWPVDGIEINGQLYFFYLMVTVTPGTSAINLYGTGVVRSTFPYETFERLPSIRPMQPKKFAILSELPFIWWDNSIDRGHERIPAIGTAVLKDIVDNYIYIYGSKVKYNGDSTVHTVSLARVKKNDIEDITKYEYLAEAPSKRNDFKPKWCDDPKKTADIFDGNANELSVSYNPYLAKYVAIYSSVERVNGNEEIHMRTSKSPAGPWSKPLTIYRPQRSHTKDYCYAAKEHPEYSKDLGKTLYVTYVCHQCYFPVLLEIELGE